MEKQKKPVKKPVSNESIFKTMMILTFAVAAAFLAKNLLSKEITSAIMIGICLIVFGAVMLIMRKLKLAVDKQQLVVCLSFVILQFIVSLNSGNYYSDDFPHIGNDLYQPTGKMIYKEGQDLSLDTDACMAGHISVSPITIKRTHWEAYEALQGLNE